MKTYRPAETTPEDWQVVADFAKDATLTVADVQKQNDVPRLLKVVGPYLVWCVFDHGLDLVAEQVFTGEFIQLYCDQFSTSTAANYRSVLRVFARTLVGPDVDLTASKPARRKVLDTPYSAGELLTYRTWARAQVTQVKQRRGHLMLALGAGAGLRAGELVAVRGHDVAIHPDGVTITVHGQFPREVTVLARWEESVADIAADNPADHYLWMPKTGRVGQNTLSQFTGAAAGPAPSSMRLRTTWLTGHLAAGTPMKELFLAAGLQSMDNLADYLTYIAPAAPADHRRLLRQGLQA